MQILLASAKIMTGTCERALPCISYPAFQSQAYDLAIQLSRYTAEELQHVLKVDRRIAELNRMRFHSFFDESLRQSAVFRYDGMVFQKLAPETWTDDELVYANSHLFVASFMYGLLRPLDRINSYRLEGNVVLPGNGYRSMFDYWKPLLTDWFIATVKADDGVFVNLASNEFRHLFDWKRVTRELTVVTPEFKVMKEGRLKTIVIYAKMCRGAMAKWMIRNRVTDVSSLEKFEYEGFCHEQNMSFVLR